jgi:cell division protein FtsW (lipid II flippase)
MKKIANRFTSTLLLMLSFILIQIPTYAQDKININEAEVSSWFARNWMWVAGGVILLLLIVLFSRGSSSRRKTTTVVKDQYGDVRSVTTTEEKV